MRTDFDVIVCGGGIAGIAAALASAREGASTCLVEKEYCLGGLATLGLIVVYLPLCDGDGVQMSGGIAEELALISLKYGPGSIPEVWKNKGTTTSAERAGKRYEVRYQAAPMMLAAEELLLDAGVTVCYDVRLASAATEIVPPEATEIVTPSMPAYGSVKVASAIQKLTVSRDSFDWLTTSCR